MPAPLLLSSTPDIQTSSPGAPPPTYQVHHRVFELDDLASQLLRLQLGVGAAAGHGLGREVRAKGRRRKRSLGEGGGFLLSVGFVLACLSEKDEKGRCLACT